MDTSIPCYTLSTCSRNFIDLYTNLSFAVNESHITIRHLAFHPHAGSIQTLVKSMESYAQSFSQVLGDCYTQSQRGPHIDPTTEVIMQDTMSRIYEQLEGLYLLHALALEIFKNLQPTNISDQYHQGPPPHLAQGFANRSQHHYSQMIQKLTLRCQHHLIKIVQKFPIKCQHQIQIRNHQVREGTKWTQEPDGPIQEVSWHDIHCVPPKPDQNRKSENEVPIQEVSWYASPGVPENEIPPNYSDQIIAKST